VCEDEDDKEWGWYGGGGKDRDEGIEEDRERMG
jgi:hypothetical protein